MTEKQIALATYYYMLWLAELGAEDYAEWVHYHVVTDYLEAGTLSLRLGEFHNGLLELCQD